MPGWLSSAVGFLAIVAVPVVHEGVPLPDSSPAPMPVVLAPYPVIAHTPLSPLQYCLWGWPLYRIEAACSVAGICRVEALPYSKCCFRCRLYAH